ncbi:hypothetical protein IFM89_017072 [Coptis chinensis]|uniref:Uncharacterized protein n=1 Tax=Coptis chinensis TaxID=261450 RepID=A0A835IX92_9MAGN|nr:hypothetical protein IFM89_017072 [Coptis chinensis]
MVRTPCTDPVVEPVIEEENTEAEGLGMGNFVDASYGVHEVVACDLNEDEENHMGILNHHLFLNPIWGRVNHSLVHLNLPVRLTCITFYFSFTSISAGDVQESENVRKLPILIDIDGVVVGDNASDGILVFGSLIRAHYPLVTPIGGLYILNSRIRYGKWVLRKDILNKFETLEEQIAACPAGIDPNHWEQFVIYENTSEELVEDAQKKRKSATSSGRGGATHLDFDNDELTEVLGADKKSRTRGISSSLSKKQLKRTSIAKVMLAQARSSSNSEFKGEMSEMKSSIARVEGVLMDMLKLVTNNGMSNSQPPHGDTTPGTDVGSNSVRHPNSHRLSQYDANGSKARTLEQSIEIHVIRHGVKKPGGSVKTLKNTLVVKPHCLSW